MMTMKLANLCNLLALSAALTIAGAGCRHTPVTTDIGGIPRPRPGNPNPGPEFQSGRPLNNNGFGSGGTGFNANGNNGGNIPLGKDHSDWAANSEVLSAQTIHFDYDKSAIKSSEESKLNAVAEYLKSHPRQALRIEGNCDERGTEEYNRSLGERRALAAREDLASQGIDPSRMDTVTYGKDKPVDTGHDESAFAKNRRDDFVILTAPGDVSP
jgi:peptidoglycan-associated lipoprotein